MTAVTGGWKLAGSDAASAWGAAEATPGSEVTAGRAPLTDMGGGGGAEGRASLLSSGASGIPGRGGDGGNDWVMAGGIWNAGGGSMTVSAARVAGRSRAQATTARHVVFLMLIPLHSVILQ
ncbi:MAG: hypothetical protein BWY66_00153 [bacterium ADurb.Bin374]|nr:MAG: hypothetical protein BWY66_00153 [bacterium ADurb.Bin374]